MLVRVRPITVRLFPHGPVDVLRQILLFAIAYYAYRMTRGWIDDGQGAAVAFENARHLVNIEQTALLSVERNVQDFPGGWDVAQDIASLLYMNAQVGVTLAALVFIYMFHNE